VGWPLLTVETEVNRDSKSTYERSSSLVGSLDHARAFCSAWAALVGPVQNIFSSPYIFSISLSLSPSKLSTGQAAVLGRLSVSKYLW
jgi:hypothetical protein